MRRVIRAGMFETNSSSCHSIMIPGTKSPEFNYDVFVNRDGYIHSSFGEFGWEIASHYSFNMKLSYALTMVAETEIYDTEFYETEGFKAINNIIKEKTRAEGVIVDHPYFKREIWSDELTGRIHSWMSHDGYIDHQSCEDYNSLNDFLKDYDISLERFLFDDNVCVYTDNDNH